MAAAETQVAVLSANQEVMAAGSVVQLYTGSADAPTSKPAFLWWDCDAGGKLGSIFFNESTDKKEKTKVEGNTLPMNKITDVFSGKQGPIFKSASLSALPADCCFSLGSKVMPLNVQVETAAARSAWIAGIKEIFSKGVQKKAAPASPAAATSNPASAAASGADPIAAMVAGQTFVSLTAVHQSTVRNDIFVFYDKASSKFGVLYQTPASQASARNQDEATGIPMHTVSDVFLGKRAAEFTGEPTSTSQCFSIVSKERSLHLIAPSEPVRATWLSGIKEIFAQQKQAAAAKKAAAGAAPSSPAPAQPNVASAPNSPAPATTSSSAPPTILSEGRSYRSLTTVDGKVVSENLYLWHDPNDGKLGTLYYSNVDGDRTKNAQKSMPVSKIKDVFMGKQTPEFKSDFAKDIPSNQCFSLMLNKERGEGLHLIAADDQARNATLATIKGFWAVPKKKAENGTAVPAAATDDKAAADKKAAEDKAAADKAASAAAAAAAAALLAEKAAADKAAADKAAADKKAADEKAAADKKAADEKAAAQAKKDAEAAAAAAEAKKNADAKAAADKAEADKKAAAAAAPLSPAKTVSLDASSGATMTEGPASPTSAASKSESAKLAEEVAADPIGNVATMKAGAVFKSYTIVPNSQEESASEDVFVWLSQDDEQDGSIGSLYYQPGSASSKQKSSDRQMPLSQMKDVFVGKHAWKKAGAAAPSFPTSRALSLVAGQKALHLEAADDRTRARWATGIRNVFENAQKKAEENKKAAAAAAAAAALLAPAAVAEKSASPAPVAVVAPAAEGADLLTQGGVFQSHVAVNGTLQSKPVFLWYDPNAEKLGTMHWCEPGKKEIVAGQSLPMHKCSDVTLGKVASIKEAEGSANIRTANCFSLSSKSTAINLEAKDAAQRSAWITAIKGIFSNAGKKVEESKKKSPSPAVDATPQKKAPESAAVSSSSQLVLPEVPMSPRSNEGSSGASSPATLAKTHEHPLPVVATPISEGQDFDQWVFDEKGARVAGHPVHVWFEKDVKPMGALFWAPGNGNRQRVAGNILPLNEVTDVFVGKHVEEFLHADAAGIPHDRCISLRSQSHPDHNLNLVAQSAQAQRRWTRGLKKAFAESSETVIETRPVKSGEVPPEAVSSPKSARAIKSKLASLADGHNIQVVAADGSRSNSTLWFEAADARAGTVYWSADRSKGDDRLPVHTISDVFLGRKAAAFKTDAAQSIPSNRAFSLASKSRRLDAVAASEEDRKKILDGISAAIHAAGTPVKEVHHGAASPSPVSGINGIRGELSYIEQGQVMLLHTANAAPRSIFLWYESSHGKQGALFWNTPQGQPNRNNKVAKQTILLQHISDVMSGAQSDILSTIPGLKNEVCFSLFSTNGPRLDLQLNSHAERNEWLNSLRRIFNATSKRIVEGSGVVHSRRFQPNTVVDTWYGRGTVVDTTRKDGITKVDVGGTICYFNGESIKAVPVIYTPYGPGVSPLNDKKRADGISRVELAWASAYLNAESMSNVDPKAAANAVSQSRDQSVAYLTAGQSFTHVGAQLTPVFIYLNTNSGGIGSLDYNVGAARTSTPTGSIPLKHLSDLLLGKQSPPLRALPDQPDSRAVSIVTKDGLSLDLLASSDSQRTSFVYALFNLLQTTGRKITQQKGDALSPQAAVSPVAGDSTRRYSFASPQLPSKAKALADLNAGAPFRLILLRPDGTTLEDDATVYLNGENLQWASTYWGSASLDAKDPLRFMTLDSLRDVWYNKKTSVFQQAAYASTPAERCFSIGNRERIQWNLIAADKDTRDRFFFSLQAILRPASSPSPAASSNAIGSPASGDIVSRGAVFTRWEGEASSLKSSSIFLFHEYDGSKYGALYWNAQSGDRTRSPVRSLPLQYVKDVYQGTQTATTKAAASASGATKDLFVSLVATAPKDGPATALHLQASNAAQRNEFMDSLKPYFSKTRVANAATPVAPGPVGGFGVAPVVNVKHTGPALTQPFLHSLGNTSQHSLHISPIAAIQFIQTGSTFNSTDGSKVDAFYVASQGVGEEPFGAIHTAAVGSRTLNADKAIAIHRIEEVIVRNSRSFELVTGSDSLFLESDHQTASAWLGALTYLFGVGGFRVTADKEHKVFRINDKNQSGVQTSAPAIAHADSTAFVKDGPIFNGLFPSFSGTTRTTTRLPVHVFAEGTSLYWCAATQREALPNEHEFAFSALTRVITGKNGPTSVTLQTKDNQLDLEAESIGSLSLWLYGLTATLNSHHISIKTDRDASSESKRAYIISRSKDVPRVAAPASSPVSPSSAAANAAAVEEFNAKGGVFTAYTMKKGKLVHKDLIVWIANDDSGAAHLYWGGAEDAHAQAREPEVEGDNELEVLDITTAEVGKSSLTLKLLPDETVAAANCVSISSESLKLDLVAETPARATAIVQAIQARKQ